MVITPGFLLVAQKLAEAATAMSHGDIRTRLSDALGDALKTDALKTPGSYGYSYAYVVDVFGDDSAGDVVYSYNDDLKKAKYSITAGGAKIDTTTAVDVSPLTTYEVDVEPAEGLTEAGARNSKRDMAQIQAIHDSTSKLGANCKMAEARVPRETAPGTITLVESAPAFLGEISLIEAARTHYPVLLISPGTGTKAHYTAKVLERDGPKVAKAGTLLYWNHATRAEEAARPEGNLDNMAAILTSDAHWDANGAKGPGLYSTAKVMADYATKVAERAPHIGLSIRGGGTPDGTMIDGVPVLKSLDYIESVDYVTKAGRGGLALAEAARDAGILTDQEQGMNEQEKTQLQEAVASNARLLKRAIRGDARELAAAVLKDITLAESAKARVIETCLANVPEKDGDLDRIVFAEAVKAEAKREGAYVASFAGSGRVTGMGSAPSSVELTEAQRTEADAAEKRREADGIRLFESFGLSNDAAKLAAKGRAA